MERQAVCVSRQNPKSRTRFTVQPAQPQKCPPTGPRDAKESKNGARAAITSGNSEERWASASQKLGFSRAANGRTYEQRLSVTYNHARRMCRVGRGAGGCSKRDSSSAEIGDIVRGCPRGPASPSGSIECVAPAPPWTSCGKTPTACLNPSRRNRSEREPQPPRLES